VLLRTRKGLPPGCGPAVSLTSAAANVKPFVVSFCRLDALYLRLLSSMALALSAFRRARMPSARPRRVDVHMPSAAVSPSSTWDSRP
jgi:hypothetical protein